MSHANDEQKSARLHHVRSGTLSGGTAQSDGMQRYEAISGVTTGSFSIWMGESRMQPSTRSALHHHGDSETGIFIVRGAPVFVYFEGDQEHRIETKPGDYVFVPPFVPHREENPSNEEAVVVLARSTQAAIVVNLPEPPGTTA